MKNYLIIIILLILSSCFLFKKKKNQEVVNQVNNTTPVETKSKKEPMIVGDTTIIITNSECKYAVQDLSKMVSLPDSLEVLGFKQSHVIGDTLLSAKKVSLEIYCQNNNKVDTLYYIVNLSCCYNEIPQFISPNGHGKSDVWEIPCLTYFPNNTVKIYNRWGNKVYEKESYKDEFIGQFNIKNESDTNNQTSKMLPAGTYFYIIDLGDTTLPLTGYVYVKR